jgi:hypothetical protein
VLTFIGDGTTGQNNGVGSLASLTNPTSIDVSSTGIVYFNSGERIRAASENTSEVYTAAGSIAGALDDLLLRARLNSPAYIALDNFRGGNVAFFIDRGSSQLRRATFVDVCATRVCSDGNTCTDDTCSSPLQGCIVCSSFSLSPLCSVSVALYYEYCVDLFCLFVVHTQYQCLR